MNDNDSVDSNHSNYKIHHVGNSLDIDGYLYSNDINVGYDFVGDNEDFDMLSKDAPTIAD